MHIMAEFKLNNEQTAMRLSELLYQITTPEGADTTGKYLFGWDVIDGETFIRFPDDYETAIFVKLNFYEVVTEIGQILNNDLAPGEGAELVNRLKTGRVKLIDLIPNKIVENSTKE
jgi:hypothetical protein